MHVGSRIDIGAELHDDEQGHLKEFLAPLVSIEDSWEWVVREKDTPRRQERHLEK